MKSYSNDQLRKLTDDELIKEYMSVRSKINIAKKKKTKVVNLEIYFCYVSREVQEREKKSSMGKNRVTTQKV
jgi:hypothetical protein